MTTRYRNPTPADVAARRAQLAPLDGWNERAFCQIVAWAGLPARYLDLGSGTGAMVNMARKIGVEAFGVDVINGPEHWFIHHDLTRPLYFAESADGAGLVSVVREGWEQLGDPDPQFDLITCLEVAEHLPEDAAPVLAATIARHLAKGGRLLFSAAPPGQRGEHHVNCQPAGYWRSLLYEHGVSYRDDYTRQLAHLLGYVTGPASHWLAANLQVFDA